MIVIMRNLMTTILTSLLVLGVNVSSVQTRPQELSKQAVQAPSEGLDMLAGCYRVAFLSWSPSDADIKLIPPQFELLNVPRVPGSAYFNIRSLGVKSERDPWEAFWSWRPKSTDKLEINWGTGLGGFRGTLKRSGNGELVGKIKEYCDSHCEYVRRIGSLHVQKIGCGPN
jgi:hypothetical protein